MLWLKEVTKTVNVQTEIVNRKREPFSTLHEALVTRVWHLQVRYICLENGAQKLGEGAGENCKCNMKDLKSSMITFSKEDIKR